MEVARLCDANPARESHQREECETVKVRKSYAFVSIFNFLNTLFILACLLSHNSHHIDSYHSMCPEMLFFRLIAFRK